MNKLVIAYLKKLETLSKNKDDIYRSRAFKKARQVVNSLDFEIKNISELKNRPGLGKGILTRIQEILQTNHLQEVDSQITDEKDISLEQFQKIYGVGQKTAERWYKNGHRSINDIILNENLTSAQKIGIKYYEELNLKIPRKNIEEIDHKIQNIIKQINRENKIHLICIIAGSYRRGFQESGDIDCLLSNKDDLLSENQINLFLEKLKLNNILTDELGKGESKYIGVCIDKDDIHRRIDFEFVRKYISFPYELLYSTGSQSFNLEMRQKAKDLGYLLNQNGLYYKDNLIEAKNEKEIFEKLGMKFLKPEERN